MAGKQAPWERDEASWGDIEESKDGGIRLTASKVNQQQQRTKLAALGAFKVPDNVRHGMIRYTVLILDLSKAARGRDLRPNRLSSIVDTAIEFVRRYFTENPLSHLSIVMTRNETATELSPLGCNRSAHIQALSNEALILPNQATGMPSLDASLQFARSSLERAPDFAVKEAVVVFASLTTCDIVPAKHMRVRSGNVHITIKALAEEKIVCSVVGIGAEMFILRKLVEATGGMYSIATERQIFELQLLRHVSPPPLPESCAPERSVPMRVGFPVLKPPSSVALDSAGDLVSGGFECPQCRSRQSGDLPMECETCHLRLLSAPQLVRSSHHLMPVPPYVQQPSAAGKICFGCKRALKEEDIVSQCPLSKKEFCVTCDIYIHKDLHNCPGCLARE